MPMYIPKSEKPFKIFYMIQSGVYSVNRNPVSIGILVYMHLHSASATPCPCIRAAQKVSSVSL